MREIISVSIGQCGVQLGTSLWDLFCVEHEIDELGRKKQSSNLLIQKEELLQPFFQEIIGDKYIPRQIFIDLDPTTIDEVRNGLKRSLFNPQGMISGKEDGANNYARGRYFEGKLIQDQCQEQIRKESEKCDNLQGILYTSSTSGGTSSGLGSLLQEFLQRSFNKTIIINNLVIPSNQFSSSTVEPYNAVLSLSKFKYLSDANIVFQNQPIYDICSNMIDIENPSFQDINKLISQVISSYTTSIRFRGDMNQHFGQLLNNLVPFRKINFLIPSYSPFIHQDCINKKLSIKSITQQVFSNENCFVNCSINTGKYLACSYMVRGDIVPKTVIDSINILKAKKTIQFTDWCPTGFKLGVNSVKPKSINGDNINFSQIDGCLISNSSSFSQIISQICYKFDLMYAKRAFVHWYVSSMMEEGEFSEAREDLRYLGIDYEEVSTQY